MKHPAHYSPRRHTSSMLKPCSSLSESKRSDTDKKRRFDCTRDLPRADKHSIRKRDAFSASIHRQEPLRISPHKRNRSFAVDQHAIPIHNRNPPIEICRDSFSDKSYTPRAAEIDCPRRSERNIPGDSRSSALNKGAYAMKWHRRLKPDSGGCDRLQITAKHTIHSPKTIKPSKTPSIPTENRRRSISLISTRWNNVKAEPIRKEEVKRKNLLDERSEEIRNEKIHIKFSEIKLENCQRIEAWDLACALAYDYLKKKDAAEGKGEPAQTGGSHSVGKAVKQQERCKPLQKVNGSGTKSENFQALSMKGHKGEVLQKVQDAATKGESFQAWCKDQNQEEAMLKVKGGPKKDSVLEGLSMDGVVNPSQAASCLVRRSLSVCISGNMLV